MAVIPSLWVAIPTMWKEAIVYSLREIYHSARAQFPILNTVNEVTPVGLLLIAGVGGMALATMLTNLIFRLLVGQAQKPVQSELKIKPKAKPKPLSEPESEHTFERVPEPILPLLSRASEPAPSSCENTAELEITDEKVFQIINANPDVYCYQKNSKGTNLNPDALIRKIMDKDQLVARLTVIRQEMQACFGDGTTQYEQLRHILLSALNAKDLAPLNLKTKIDLINADFRIDLAAHYAGYISYVSPEAFKQESIKNAERGTNDKVLADHAFHLREGIDIYANVVNSVCGLDEVRAQYPNPDVVDTNRPLTPESKFDLLQGLATVIQRETRMKEEAKGLASDFPVGRERLGL